MRSVCALLVAILVLGSARADDLGNVILARLGQVSQRQQGFHETRTIRALNAPLRSQGTLIFRKPDYLEKRTTAPRFEDLVISGDTISITRGQAPARLIDAAQNPALAMLVSTLRGPLEGDGALLRRYYTINASGDLGSWTLSLTPANAGVAKFIRSVTITGHNNAIADTRVVQANGDTQTTTIDP